MGPTGLSKLIYLLISQSNLNTSYSPKTKDLIIIKNEAI
tara:strand:- start:5186 stop:5302 length:117 start_codon:yes stop_codon:yes gene_type:complete